MNIEILLKQNGKKVTPERCEIANWITKKHLFTSADILQDFTHIGRASVFRSLKLFNEIAFIRKINLWDWAETQYEINHSHHHHEHMKCNSCEDILSFESENICQKLFLEAKKRWFHISQHSISILWTCKNCTT